MLAWMTDKLFTWSDNYPWTPTEVITGTLLRWFPGPTTPFYMYRKNDALKRKIIPCESTPTGVSAFAGEMEMVPRSRAGKTANMRYWREHEHGGHFAAYEAPAALAGDLIEFIHATWKKCPLMSIINVSCRLIRLLLAPLHLHIGMLVWYTHMLY